MTKIGCAFEPFYRAFRFRLFEWHKAIYYTELGRAWDRPDDAIHRKIARKERGLVRPGHSRRKCERWNN